MALKSCSCCRSFDTKNPAGSDLVQLTGYTLSAVTLWQAVDSADADVFVNHLRLTFANGSILTIENYFSNTNADEDLSAAPIRCGGACRWTFD